MKTEVIIVSYLKTPSDKSIKFTKASFSYKTSNVKPNIELASGISTASRF